jgi:hypothetical protein
LQQEFNGLVTYCLNIVFRGIIACRQAATYECSSKDGWLFDDWYKTVDSVAGPFLKTTV